MGEAPTVAASTPKLLELDKKDVAAVRSFLPGKVLGRTAALLALVVLVLGFAGSLDVGLERFLGFPLEPPWLKYMVLIGLPVLIVAAQIIAEWAAERKRKQAQALAVKVDAVPEGYFRIGPYLDTAEDRAKFDRADRAHEKVLGWVKRAEVMPLYLTGDSGSGKSSVLNAYALPELREAGWTVVEARAWQDPETALVEAVVKLTAARKWKRGDAKTLRDRLEVLARRADEKLLLVLDQFEEFVILAGSERQKAFTAVIEDLRAKPIKGLKLLLVLRSDYTTAIDELGLPLLRQRENWQEVGRFTTAAGTKFMARSGLALEPTALDRLATSASELDDSPGMIRPITLNVVGHVLSQGRASAPSLDAGLLVRQYIEQSVEQPAIREFAPRVLGELVTEQGTKRPRSERELVDQTGLRSGEVRAVMNGLWTAALARPLDGAQGVWELSHDFVARAVARYLGRRRLDVLGLIGAYAAPALFVLLAAGATGAVAWKVTAEDRARAQLADFGLDVSSDRHEAAASPRFKAENWTKAVTLLGRLSALETLNLSDTGVADIGALKEFAALKKLDLSSTRVADIGPLKGLTALQTLDLSYTRVEDIEPLKDLTALQTLNLNNTRVSDIGPVSGLTALQSPRLYNTRVSEVGPLKRLTELQTLDLSSTRVAGIGPLKGLTDLQTLKLYNTNVSDIGPLIGHAALKSLDLAYTQVADIGPLDGLTALQSLRMVRAEKVRDFRPLLALTALKSLDLAGATNVNLELFHSLPALEELNLSSIYDLRDIRPLKDLIALTKLNISFSHVSDLEPLKGLAKLKTLDLTDTDVTDLGPLKALTALEELDLSMTRVADLTPLQDLPDLKTVTGAPSSELQRLNAYRVQKKLRGVGDRPD